MEKIYAECFEEIEKQISLLADINTNFDYTSEYDRGYKDACTAIKNTVYSILDRKSKKV